MAGVKLKHYPTRSSSRSGSARSKFATSRPALPPTVPHPLRAETPRRRDSVQLSCRRPIALLQPPGEFRRRFELDGFGHPDPAHIRQLLREAGFNDVQTTSIDDLVCVGEDVDVGRALTVEERHLTHHVAA